jgi:hypothetical protein
MASRKIDIFWKDSSPSIRLATEGTSVPECWFLNSFTVFFDWSLIISRQCLGFEWNRTWPHRLTLVSYLIILTFSLFTSINPILSWFFTFLFPRIYQKSVQSSASNFCHFFILFFWQCFHLIFWGLFWISSLNGNFIRDF